MNLFAWLRAWFNRNPGLLEMPAMPPLPLGCPAHERPDEPLSGCERIRFALLAESCKDPEIVAVDPMEQP